MPPRTPIYSRSSGTSGIDRGGCRSWQSDSMTARAGTTCPPVLPPVITSFMLWGCFRVGFGGREAPLGIMAGNVEQNPNCQHRDDQRASPKAYERKGNTGEGKRCSDDRHVDECLNDDRRRNADGEKPGEVVWRVSSHAEAAIGEQNEEPDDGYCSEETQLLRAHGKDAVGIGCRKVVFLLAVPEAYTGESTQAQGEERLDGVISGAMGVLPRVQPSGQPRAPVCFELQSDQREKKGCRCPQEEMIEAGAGHEIDDQHRQHDDDRSSHVRLLEDE